MRRKHRRMLLQAFRIAGADKIFLGYLVLYLVSAVVIMIAEPAIESYGDSLWYCFAVATTVGFGDFAAVTLVGRIVTVVLSIYSIAVVAIFTAVITSYFMDLAKAKASDSARAFIDDLEHLSELSKEELDGISERVKRFKDGKM